MTDETKREILKAHRLGYSNDIIASVCEITEEEVEAKKWQKIAQKLRRMGLGVQELTFFNPRQRVKIAS